MFRLKIQNMRALRSVDFSCEGVNLLIGPNGSGKTTLLRTLYLLKLAAQQDVRHAFDVRNMRSFAAAPTDPVMLELVLDDLFWRIDFDAPAAEEGQMRGYVESVAAAGTKLAIKRSADERILFPSRQPGEWRFDPSRSALKMLVDVLDPPEVRPLSTWLNSLRWDPVTGGITSWGPALGVFSLKDTGDLTLETGYTNVFTVLRNWRDTRKLRGQFDRLMQELRTLFPHEFYELDFKPEVAVVPPGHDRAVPIWQMSDGFLSSLLHLASAVSMQSGGLLLIDQIEDNLHPAAIAGLLAAVRRLADERGFAVLLTTHSPYVLNLFDDAPEQVYVLEPSAPVQPVRLTDLHDAAWLAHFRLGNLYGVEFAKQDRAAQD